MFKITINKVVLALAVILVATGCKKDYDPGVTPAPTPGGQAAAIDWNKAADSSTGSLMGKFWNASGNYFNDKNTSTVFNYWPQAHGLDVLVDAYTRTSDNKYKTYMNNWYTGVKQKNGNGFINEYYDDMGWNGLAMLRAYDVTNEEKFKAGVEEVWEDIKKGWNNTMGGGIAWRKQMPYYKNTPANGPAAILAARLYTRFKNPDDLEWSKKIYAFIRDNLFNKSTGWVYDGINEKDDGKLNTEWKFTYNQGLFIGAAIELYKITNESSYLSDALLAANFTLSDNVLTNLNDNLLRDEGGVDGGLFKGVFVRYFTQLILTQGVLSSDKQRYVAYLKHNAQTMWSKGTDKNYLLYGSYWKNAPGATTDLTVQLSGAMLIEAAALLKKNNLF